MSNPAPDTECGCGDASSMAQRAKGPEAKATMPLSRLRVNPHPGHTTQSSIAIGKSQKPTEATAWDFNKLGAKPTSLEQRFALAFDRKLGFDVTFEIGSQKTQIQAHRIILGTASSVFAGMFFEKDASAWHSFPDCKPKAFQALLWFIYKRELTSMPIAEVPGFLHVGKKFNVPKFLESINESLLGSISTENVFEIEKIGIAYKLGQNMFRLCWSWIEERTEEVLDFHINNLDLDMFVEILKSDHLVISEPSLFKFVLKWSNAECSKRIVQVNQENLRIIAQPLLNWLRFPKLPDPEFPNSLLREFYTEAEIEMHGDNLNQLALVPPSRRIRRGNIPAASPALASPNREVGVPELIRALLPMERRKSFTLERMEKLYQYVEEFLRDSSEDRKKLEEFFKTLQREI